MNARLEAARARMLERRARAAELTRQELAAPTFPPKLALSDYLEGAPRCPACRSVVERRRVDEAFRRLACGCGWSAVEIGSEIR